MRHHRNTNHLSRNAPHARALLRNVAAHVLIHQQVTTTLANAKAARPLIERVITLGKTGDLNSRRRALSLLANPVVTRRLFAEIAPLFTARRGGYTRVIRLGPRRGDGAQLAVLELTERLVVAPPAAAPKKRTAKHAPPAAAEPGTSTTAAKPLPSAEPSAPGKRAQPSPQQKPPKLFEGLRKWWGRRQGDRGGSRG